MLIWLAVAMCRVARRVRVARTSRNAHPDRRGARLRVESPRGDAARYIRGHDNHDSCLDSRRAAQRAPRRHGPRAVQCARAGRFPDHEVVDRCLSHRRAIGEHGGAGWAERRRAGRRAVEGVDARRRRRVALRVRRADPLRAFRAWRLDGRRAGCGMERTQHDDRRARANEDDGAARRSRRLAFPRCSRSISMDRSVHAVHQPAGHTRADIIVHFESRAACSTSATHSSRTAIRASM